MQNWKEIYDKYSLLENDFAFFYMEDDERGHIVCKSDTKDLFSLEPKQLAAMFSLLREVKELLTSKYHPDGLNIGWNVGEAAGQKWPFVSMFIIPRFEDEANAGLDLADLLFKVTNKRLSQTEGDQLLDGLTDLFSE